MSSSQPASLNIALCPQCMAVNDAAVLRCIKCGSGIRPQHGRAPDSQPGAFHVVMGQDGSAAIEWSEEETEPTADLLAQEAGLSGQQSSSLDRPPAAVPPAQGSALPHARPPASQQAQKLGISFAGGALVAAIVVVSVYEVQHMWRDARLGASPESAQETRRSEGFATDPRLQRNPLLAAQPPLSSTAAQQPLPLTAAAQPAMALPTSPGDARAVDPAALVETTPTASGGAQAQPSPTQTFPATGALVPRPYSRAHGRSRDARAEPEPQVQPAAIETPMPPPVAAPCTAAVAALGLCTPDANKGGR